MSGYVSEEIERDAENLARKISPDDYETIKLFWQKKRYAMIASKLRMYGVEFKGITYLEVLINELIKIMEHKK